MSNLFFHDPNFELGYEYFELFWVIYSVVGAFVVIFGLVTYILSAVGVYKMSRTLGTGCPWIAFIPVVNVYALGRIAQHAPTSSGRRPPRYGAMLLSFYLITLVSTIGVFASAAVILFTVANTFGGFEAMLREFLYSYYNYMGYIPLPALEDALMGPALAMLLFLILMLVFAILYTVFYYITLYKVYKLFNPSSSTVFLILSLFFNIAIPFLLFSLRNKLPQYAATAPAGAYPSYPQYPTYPTNYPPYQPPVAPAAPVDPEPQPASPPAAPTDSAEEPTTPV